jgi:hypothetical protein
VGEEHEAFVQRRAIAQRLLGRRTGLVLGDFGKPEQPVGRGHDGLNLGAGLRLQQPNAVDQDRLIGDQLASDIDLGERRACLDTGLQNGMGRPAAAAAL